MPILACAAASLATGVCAALLRSRPLALVGLAAVAVAVALGVAGWSEGMGQMEASLETVSPDQVEMAREIGGRIARATLVLAGFAAPGLVAAIVGLLRARRSG
ncbi:MAG: hypothetical protein R3B09_13575 [Nannocystaceae bacterium]